MSVHQVKALEESASGNNEAAVKHLSISKRSTDNSKFFNLDKVGQKFKKKAETLMASYKEGNEIMEKKAKQPMIAFHHKIFCI
jgi:hypothetical protein